MNRVLPGIVMAAAWLALLLLGPFSLFWVVILCGAMVGLHEFFRMILPDQPAGQRFLLIGIGAIPVLASFWGTAEGVLAGLAASLLVLVAIVLCRHGRADNLLAFFSSGALGILYLSLCTAHLVLLRSLDQGAAWLVVLSTITAGSDTGAYYAGRAFGRTKLCPGISPGKTVAGAVGGVVAGGLAAVAAALLLGIAVSPLMVGLAAIILVTIGIAGDLIESVVKRAVGVKDSGTILAGHGGLLDRVDSLLLTAPFLYHLLVLWVLV